jgi:ArsR family transcriptional regulator, arsenate/arsenite/antimonite-responsive transcriptional repressor
MPKSLPIATLDLTGPVCCDPLSGAGMLEDAAALELAVRLKALADPVRLQLVTLLLSSPDLEACTCDLAPAVKLNEATVSHHLKKLLATGLVSKRRDGMNVHYRVDPDAMRALSRVLNVNCC